MDAETRAEQQRILAARDTEFVFGEGGVADQIQAELVLRAEGWERSWRRADAEREALARLHEVATERTVRLAAVIEKARSAYEDGEMEPAFAFLAAADTAAVLRKRDAEKWDEGYEAGEQAGLMPSMHGDADNPYREGADRG